MYICAFMYIPRRIFALFCIHILFHKNVSNFLKNRPFSPRFCPDLHPDLCYKDSNSYTEITKIGWKIQRSPYFYWGLAGLRDGPGLEIRKISRWPKMATARVFAVAISTTNKTQAKARLGFLRFSKVHLDHFWNNKMGQILKILLCASRTNA